MAETICVVQRLVGICKSQTEDSAADYNFHLIA